MADRQKELAAIKFQRSLVLIAHKIKELEDKIGRAERKAGRTIVQTMGQTYHHKCHNPLYAGMSAIPRLDRKSDGGYCVICLQELPM
jgi:RNase P subunit RPR2